MPGVAVVLILAASVTTRAGAPIASVHDRLASAIAPWIGTGYHYGKNDKKRGTDCSGFVQRIVHDSLAIDLPRTSRDQFRVGRAVKRKKLAAGDLVFFSMRSEAIDHVGIYMGRGKFAHASKSRGVVYDDLDDYRGDYRGARRILK